MCFEDMFRLPAAPRVTENRLLFWPRREAGEPAAHGRQNPNGCGSRLAAPGFHHVGVAAPGASSVLAANVTEANLGAFSRRTLIWAADVAPRRLNAST